MIGADNLPCSPQERDACGIYVHIPFCLVRCGYCDFNAYAGMDDLMGPYVEALIREVRAAADGSAVRTVFFGGGTPTQLSARALGRILRALRQSFSIDPGAEITIEANPETVDERAFEHLARAGFNRVSVGVQSLSPTVLGRLGRVHGPERALDALRAAQSAGFERVNADLIFGTPGESEADWQRSLEGVVATGVDHVSAYALTIEEGTPLAASVARGRFPAPDDDEQAARYEIAHRVLTGAGMVRYEISNWALPGGWCRHNLGYWMGGDYHGFGAGAHRHRSGRRSWNVKSPRAYVDRSPGAEEACEELTGPQRRQESAMLGLRLAGGIDRARFAGRWGADPMDLWGEAVSELVRLGLVDVSTSCLRPSESGFFLWGHIARSLLSP